MDCAARGRTQPWPSLVAVPWLCCALGCQPASALRMVRKVRVAWDEAVRDARQCWGGPVQAVAQ